jgi:hypothetical protein
MESKLEGMKSKLKALKELLPKIKKGKLSDDPKMPKNVESC